MTIGNIPRCPPSVCGQPNKVTVSGCMCACAHVCVRELVAHDVCVRKCVCVFVSGGRLTGRVSVYTNTLFPDIHDTLS